MSGNLTDKFKISSYINDHKHDHQNTYPKPEDEKVEEAIKWSTEHGIVIILPTKKLNDLENQWIDFNSMPKHSRKISNWKSIELFGVPNDVRYYDMRSSILNSTDIENELESELDHIIYASDIPVTSSSVNESYIDHYFEDSYLEDDEVSYSTLVVDKAKTWSEEADKIIIVPTRTLAELEELWTSFNMMHKKHCRESDWMSMELFGLTNLKHYEYLKRQFLNNEASAKDMERYGSVIESVTNPYETIKRYFSSIGKSNSMDTIQAVLEAAIPSRGIYEDKIISNIVTSALNDIGELSEITPYMQNFYGDLPYFTPNDMIDMGVNSYIPTDNFYGVHADNTHINDKMTVQEWFEIYKATYDGFHTEMGSLSPDWINKLRYLTSGLNKIKESGDEKAILARKQSILELGWNPDVEFTPKARKIARECTINKMTSKKTPTRVIDLCEFRAPDISNTVFNEAISKSDLKPVYIVLTQGHSLFSKAIMTYTRSEYSHVSISLDHNLDNCYSFNAATRPKDLNDIKGGFNVENIRDIPNTNIGVFVFFIAKEAHNKIKALIESLKNNIMNTTYGYKNILTLIFNIKYNNDISMICSQFVDKCLKAAGIDITKKDSSLVTPEAIHKAATSEKYIYKLYHGIASKYNAKSISSKLGALIKKAVPLKESIYFRDETSYLIGIRNSIHDIEALKEMQHMIGLIQNESVREFVEKTIFDAITLHEYSVDSSDSDDKISLDFINRMICENLTIL